MKKGFTLIELLIVIAIIAIIAGAVLVAINPAKRIAEANDSQRWSEVNSLVNAISQFSVDNAGSPYICSSTANTYCTQIKSTVVNGYCAPTSTPEDVLATAFNETDSYIACNSSYGATCDTTSGDPDGCDITDKLIITGGYLPNIPTDPGMKTTSTSTRYKIYRTDPGSSCIEAPDKSTYTTSEIKACR